MLRYAAMLTPCCIAVYADVDYMRAPYAMLYAYAALIAGRVSRAIEARCCAAMLIRRCHARVCRCLRRAARSC